MSSGFLKVYKTPLLISFTLIVTVVALTVAKEPLDIALIILGTLGGTFVLDLDYIIYAYFTHPHEQFSQTVAAFLRHKDPLNAFRYIQYHKGEVRDKTLNSVLFQIILAAVNLFVITSTTNLFVKTLVLSTFANSIYRLLEHHFNNSSSEWFWALKNKPGKSGITIYSLILLLTFIYSLFLL
jgi:hypothetical protein